MVSSRVFSKNSNKILLFVFIAIVTWWVTISARGIQDTSENYFFSLVYSIIPLGMGLLGFLNSRRWGGLKSSLGRATFFLSAGLFAWGIGNLIFAFYNLILQVPIPYPSFADAGFVLIYPLSAIGVIYLFKATGATSGMHHKSGKLFLLFIPLVLVFLSYYLLFVVARGGAITYDGDLLKLILDIAYPVGDVIVITLAGIVFGLSLKYLGGFFKLPVILILIGFISNYISDFLFSYTTTTETYFVGKWVDLFYPLAFMLVGLGLNLLDPRMISQSQTEAKTS